ncbi:probable aspartyl protease At4g16563 [Vitis vinifera]|uniref:Peptidase A1 domain-containing protein n=3 Tax=Vitis vinifera TaxID=29760 RepID=A5B1N9_VITVI|nr:probable aspartyl protease At4g16563 [Vitis vinifera]RVX06085.1 Aspartic proteinase nepenthesin-1 [Vitis vinifera]CAN67404.1 hypothetical protein VITISV_025615 [Vitis vinifera]|eukprot:XP_002275391.1 PREDICTED: probable aspartyl protease At4g16563 [Vitis vinifera]
MASSSSSLLFSVFILFSILFLASCSKDNIPATITIPLTSTFTSKPLASASLSRAHHLKHGKTNPPVKTSLFPHSYGGHSISLSFGTPPQKLSFLVDTGSDVVWAPCTTDYTCTNCSFSAADPKKVPIFDPKLSSSSKILDCRNPKCVSTYFPYVHLGCPRCNGNSKHCSYACPYSTQYGTGASSGYFLLENLKFPRKTIRNFLLGCTTSAARELSSDALAGFGRSMFSLPIQMGVKKFAYCLNSHDYDDTRNSGKLILDYRDGKTKGLSYTPFLKSPPASAFYYHLGVKDIKIGNKLLRIPSKYLAPGSDGRSGVIIDSGYGGAGYMTGPVFKIVTNELKKQMSKYRRSLEAETQTGLTPCYNFTGHKSIKIPPLIYQFRGGANMVVPGKNYFGISPQESLACFLMDTNGTNALEITPDPSIILGNSQHVDYYVEYDLKNDRFGFRRQTC